MANGNRWSRIGEAGSKLGEALMQVAMMTENRMYRASILARQGTLDRMALERIRNDEERLRQNALQTHSTWIGQGWTGTPGTEVWTPGQLPADPVVDPTVIGDDLLGRQAAEANPLAQSAMGGMGVDLGATYPDPSPIAMGGDPSQFGAELMQTPQFGSGVAGGSFEPARYDPYRDPTFIQRQAELEHARQPTFSVSEGLVSGTGFGNREEAQGFANQTAPPPEPITWGIDGGELTVSGGSGTFEEMQGILAQIRSQTTPARTVGDAAELRGEFTDNRVVAESEDIMMAYSRLREVALAEPSGANDLTIIFSFMKMLDPGSTVRESEFANAQNAQGVPQRIRSMWNQLRRGERLTPASRTEFIRSAETVLEGQRQVLAPVLGRFQGLARRQGDPFENVGYDPFEGSELPSGSPLINIADRIDELLEEGKEEDEIYRILEAEGYNTGMAGLR